MKIHSEDAYHLLHRLGATANYTGFSYLVRALQLCAEEPERLLLVTKWLYPDVAKQYGTNWKAVERNIRTVLTPETLWMPEMEGRRYYRK